MRNLFSIGEVIDKIKPGQMAVSTGWEDEGAVILHDDENWLMIKYPKNIYFKYDHNFKTFKEGLEKRWAIEKRSKEYDKVIVLFKDDLFVIDFEEDSE